MKLTNETCMAWVSPQRLIGRWQPEMFRAEYLEIDRVIAGSGHYVRLGDLVDAVSHTDVYAEAKWHIDHNGIRRSVEVGVSHTNSTMGVTPVSGEAILVSKSWIDTPEVLYWNSEAFHGDANVHWNYWVLQSPGRESCGWLFKELQSKHSQLQLQRIARGGLTTRLSMSDLLDVRVQLIEEPTRVSINQIVLKESKARAASLLSHKLSRPFFLTGRTFEERMRQFEDFLEKEAWFSDQDAFFVEPVTRNPNSDFFRMRPINSANTETARFIPQEIPSANERWRDWFWDKSTMSRYKVFNSLLADDELPPSLLACIVKVPPDTVSAEAKLLFPGFSTFRDAVLPSLNADMGVEDQLWLDVWIDLQSNRPGGAELDNRHKPASVPAPYDPAAVLFDWSRDAYRPILALKVTRDNSVVGAYLLIGKDQLADQLETYAQLDDLGIVLSDVLHPPSDIVSEVANRESLRRLSNIMHQIKGPVGRVNNAITDVMEFLVANPTVSEEFVPSEAKARRRSQMPGGAALDRQTLRARMEDAQKAVNDVKKVAYQLIQLRRVQAGANDDRKEHFSIMELLRSCAKRCSENCPEIQISISNEADFTIWSDREHLQYAFEEVLSNSSRELRYRDVESPQITIACGKDEGEIWIRISDNGLPDDVVLIADPFEECASTYERIGLGTGLGLAIVRETFLTHGGDCSLQPNFDLDDERVPGTTFHAHLSVVKTLRDGEE